MFVGNPKGWNFSAKLYLKVIKGSPKVRLPAGFLLELSIKAQ